MDLIERLTRDRRPLGTVIYAVSRAQQALRAAVGVYTEPALTDPASGDQQRMAAALADTAVIAILGLHALGRNTAGELAAAADRVDPWGAATRFREADADSGSGAQANYAQQRYAALAADPTFRWHYGACPAVLGTGACTCAERLR